MKSNASALSQHIAAAQGITEDEACELVGYLVKSMHELLDAGQIVRLQGLATFRKVTRAARPGQDPVTGQRQAHSKPHESLRIKPCHYKSNRAAQ